MVWWIWRHIDWLIDWLIEWVSEWLRTKAAACAMWHQRAGVVPSGVEDETVSVNIVTNFGKPTANNAHQLLSVSLMTQDDTDVVSVAYSPIKHTEKLLFHEFQGLVKLSSTWRLVVTSSCHADMSCTRRFDITRPRFSVTVRSLLF